MSNQRPLSEPAQWFLKDFQKALDNFASEIGVQVIIIDKQGNLVTKLHGVQRICKLIIATEEGKTRCVDHFKMAISLMEAQKKPIFVECYAGFASIWAPIIIKESLIGAAIICGGRHEGKENIGKLKERFSKLAIQLGIMGREDFLKAAIEEIPPVTKEDMRKCTERLKELFDILSKTAHTPLKEVFG